MLILHGFLASTELFVDPLGIVTATRWNDGTLVVLSTGRVYTVKEPPIDIARLRAAWELRFNASQLEGELPIAVKMAVVDGEPSIHFVCCQITHDLDVKLKAEAELIEPPRDWRFDPAAPDRF